MIAVSNKTGDSINDPINRINPATCNTGNCLVNFMPNRFAAYIDTTRNTIKNKIDLRNILPSITLRFSETLFPSLAYMKTLCCSYSVVSSFNFICVTSKSFCSKSFTIWLHYSIGITLCQEEISSFSKFFMYQIAMSYRAISAHWSIMFAAFAAVWQFQSVR